ncbi:saposin [Kipferlia bialata]|uniref:Saposin n=1 Tax=Kipferlia bialata TaxID=797122 RepID=A0A391NQQ5_9EUKA|nr:saposin [Kipferlia bialata]GCA62546.1 saposin [Kipferlia bialata]GCA62861.1 saposin [Kipferlia bialata]|eukprot:g3791.t1
MRFFIAPHPQGLCDAFINQHFEDLLKALVNGYPADVLCELIGVCPSAVEAIVSDDPLWCSVCELVMSLIDDTLEKDSTQQEIEHLLDSVCSLLPSFLEGECDAMVATYEPLLIEALVNDYPPDTVCAMIGAC